MNYLVALVAALWTLTLAAAVIEAPPVPLDFQQNPSSITWKRIATEHFDVIFPEEMTEAAKRAAHLLERAYPFVTRSLEVSPGRIPLVLQNQSVNSNAFVTLAPRRTEWYVTPTVDPELSNTEWLKTIAIHEFRHVVQFEKTRRGFNRLYEILLGQIGQALGIGLTIPPWFLEGDAVGVETALTRGGRGRLPLFDRDLRTLLLSGKSWNYDKAHLGSYEDYVPNHYLYGYFYTTWLRNKYGDLFLSRVVNRSADTSYNPLSFYNATEALSGESFEAFYAAVMKELVAEWKTRADALTPTPYEVQNRGDRFGWTNYRYPQRTPDGNVLALKSGLSFIDQFVVLDGDKEERLFYPGVLQTEYPYKLRNGKLAFFELELDPRWGYRDYSRLRVYDYNARKFTLDKRGTKGRLAVPEHRGERIAYVEWSVAQGQSLVVVDGSGGELRRVPYPAEKVVTGLDWFGLEEVILVVRTWDDHKSIVRLNLETREETTLLGPRVENIGFLAVEDEQIFYEGTESGIDNVYVLTAEGPRQLTSALFGAYAPQLAGGKLLYNDYTVNGMNVVEKSLPWDAEERSSGSFYPIYEKFATSERFADLERDLSRPSEFAVEDYSQVRNAVNLHSWILLAPPLSNTVTVMGLSRDVLNKFTLVAGGEYNLNEQSLQGFAGATWTHLYPAFDLRAAYGRRRQTYRQGGAEFEDSWEEGPVEAGVSVPWRGITGAFLRDFTVRAFSRLIKVTNKQNADPEEVGDGALHSPGVELSYSFLRRFARRDINPALGVTLDARVEEGKDVTGTGQRGSFAGLDGRLFLPGFGHHHSFFHQVAYERQRNDAYEYAARVLYPRGTRSAFLQEFVKYSGNYLLPLFYPDWNLSRYLYLKRVTLNLFYDELSGRYRTFDYRAASTGWETILELHLARIFLPLSLGVRGSYVLEGAEKEQNYELFLASVLGTF